MICQNRLGTNAKENNWQPFLFSLSLTVLRRAVAVHRGVWSLGITPDKTSKTLRVNLDRQLRDGKVAPIPDLRVLVVVAVHVDEAALGVVQRPARVARTLQ